MKQDMRISPLENEDIEELVKLVNSAYRGDSSKKGWTTEADLLDGIRTDASAIHSLISAPGSVILVYKETVIKGCVYLHQQKAALYLGMLTVAPDQQANGIGKYLLQAAEGYAREHGCTSIVMTVIDVRTELIHWYMRHGYKPTGETKPFPDDPSFGIPRQPLQFIVLRKELEVITKD